MRTIVVVGVLLTVALAGLNTNAATLGAPTVREQNRQALLAMEGASYDPTALSKVVAVTDGVASADTVTGARALEMHLDFLDANQISLGADSGAAAAEPTWPVIGTVEMHERGWREAGAACPDIEPSWP